jgi:hypothetical protein
MSLLAPKPDNSEDGDEGEESEDEENEELSAEAVSAPCVVLPPDEEEHVAKRKPQAPQEAPKSGKHTVDIATPQPAFAA